MRAAVSESAPARLSLRDALAISVWFLITRIVVALSGFAGAARFKPGDYFHSFDGVVPRALAPFVRWDAYFYLDLAHKGYWTRGSAPVYAAAFFPLYPMTVRAFDQLVHDPVITSMLVSNVCALAAALVISRLASESTGGVGRHAAILFLASPGAGFLSFPYSESLFSLLVAAGLLAIVRDRPLLAGLFGGLASATRPTGLVIAFVLMVRAVQLARTRRPMIAYAAATVLSTAGLLAFAALCQSRYGDPLYFSHVQAEWGRHMSVFGPVRALTAFAFDPDYYAVTLAALAGAAWMLWRAPLTLSSAAWFLILVPLSTGSLKSMIRFQGANVPLLAGAAPHLRGRWWVFTLTVSLMLLAYETYEYSAGIAHN